MCPDQMVELIRLVELPVELTGADYFYFQSHNHYEKITFYKMACITIWPVKHAGGGLNKNHL